MSAHTHKATTRSGLAVDRQVEVGPCQLPGRLTVPPEATGFVVFAHGSGSSRLSPRNQRVAELLHAAGLGTLLFDLLTESEADSRHNVFDIELLSERVEEAVAWSGNQDGTDGLSIGLFGSSTGAAAALRAASRPRSPVRAVVSRGGRPDLADHWLPLVTAPTLLVVGGLDIAVLGANRRSLALLRCEKRLAIVPNATHLFIEHGALGEVAELASGWFCEHLSRGD